jgi:hypothetical protein
MNGQPGQAEEVFIRIENKADRDMGMIMAHSALGRQDRSDALLEEWLKSDISEFSSTHIAYVYAFRGDVDQAFEMLEECVLRPDRCSDIATFPMFLNLHDDPRWTPFLERIGKSQDQFAEIEFSINIQR